ncbi:MAG: helix-turn-helix domain-containing protein [Myxococcota bacterium]
MERELRDRRASSKPSDLVEFVLSRPLVSAGMIQERLKVIKQGALNLVGEFGLREMTGRERFRAWGIVSPQPFATNFTKLSNLTNLRSETILVTAGGSHHGRSKTHQS